MRAHGQKKKDEFTVLLQKQADGLYKLIERDTTKTDHTQANKRVQRQKKKEAMGNMQYQMQPQVAAAADDENTITHIFPPKRRP